MNPLFTNPDTPILFFDTEFTDFVEMDPISLGMCSLDGCDTLYVELEHIANWRSTFVNQTVVPLLDGVFHKREDAANRLVLWLNQFDTLPLIGCDYVGDATILCDLLSSATVNQRFEFEKQIVYERTLVYWKSLVIDPLKGEDHADDTIEKFLTTKEQLLTTNPRRHHALSDALDARTAWITVFPSDNNKNANT